MKNATRFRWVLLLGADGFIGRAVGAALVRDGHHLLRGIRCAHGRRTADAQNVCVDYAADLGVEAWEPRLQEVDAVINLVGIFAEHDEQTFEHVHVAAPRALFEACLRAGIRRVVQVSALGAEAGAGTEFLRSKHAADATLHDLLPTQGVVVRPSLVFGSDGASSRPLCMLGLLPVTPLPDGGAARVQPIHRDDLAELLVRLATRPGTAPVTVDAVGPRALTLAEYLDTLRRSMGGGPLRAVGWKTRTLARLSRFVGGRWLDPDALAMLAQGSTADAAAITRVLGRPPRDPSDFLDPGRGRDLRGALAWSLFAPAMRWSVALVWLGSGITSLFGWPIERSMDMLGAVGLHGTLAWVALVGGALLDIALGIATLAWRRRWVYLLQIVTIAGYTAILTIALPGYWLHPFGPLLKNLPMLVLLAALAVGQQER